VTLAHNKVIVRMKNGQVGRFELHNLYELKDPFAFIREQVPEATAIFIRIK
jgi:hypothetical protein